MENTPDYCCKRILISLFHFGALALPLVFAFNTEELFEFNKMIFVYVWTIVIGILWLLRMVLQKKLLIVKTPLDLPIIGFVPPPALTSWRTRNQFYSQRSALCNIPGTWNIIISHLLQLISPGKRALAPEPTKIYPTILLIWRCWAGSCPMKGPVCSTGPLISGK